MKKILSLITISLVIASAWADSPKQKEAGLIKQNEQEQLLKKQQGKTAYERFDFNASEKKVQAQILFDNKLKPVDGDAKMRLKTINKKNINLRTFASENAPEAFYWKPKGTMFIGPDKDAFLVGYGGIVGGWLNGLDAWVYPNGSSNYSKITYRNIVTDRIPQYWEHYSITENGSFSDAFITKFRGDLDYIYSWNTPYLTIEGNQAADTFAICAPNKADSLIGRSVTVAGAPYIFDEDGMWPLMNAPIFDANLGNMCFLLWNAPPNPEYILGTSNVTVEVASGDSTLVPAGMHMFYEKPQVPLYVKDISMWVMGFENDKYTNPTLGAKDTLELLILDAENKVVMSSTATAENLKLTPDYLGGGIITFLLEEEDEYGTIISEGITFDDKFSIVILGLNKCEGNFGVQMALNPFLPSQTLVIDDKDIYRQYVNGEPFVMLNGIYNTLEDAYPNVYIVPDDYETVNNLVFVPAEGEAELNLAVIESGIFKGNAPLLNTSFYPIDTISKGTNFKLEAPDWIDWGFYPGKDWDDFNAVQFYLFADDLPEGETSREADVTLTCYGKSITYHVKQTSPSGNRTVSAPQTKVISNADSFELSYASDFSTAVIYNISGQAVGAYELPMEGKLTVPTNDLSKGTYMVKFIGNVSETVKVVR